MALPGPERTDEPVVGTDDVMTSTRLKFLGSLSTQLPGMTVTVAHLGQLIPAPDRENSCCRQSVNGNRTIKHSVDHASILSCKLH